MPTEPRPPTVAAVLREAAEDHTHGRHAIEFTADIFSMPRPECGTQLEADLRMLATWFDMHPDLDARAHAVLDAMETT